ncbi:MAG: 23S rRNA (guanosine(2251)-2'-O)-methyltransferase RlmB [Pseudomonadota bacterium]
MKKFHPAPKNARKTGGSPSHKSGGKGAAAPQGKKYFFKSPEAKAASAKPAGVKSAAKLAAEKFEQSEGPKGARRPARENRPPGLKLSLFGQHAVTAAWLNPKRNVHALYVTPAQQDLGGILAKKAREKGLQRPDPILVEPSRLDHSLPPGSTHQGIALSSSPLFHPTLENVLGELAPDAPATVIMLDQVTDPHNIGAILRSAAAFGGQAIVMQSRNSPEPTAVMGKTACGALEMVPLCYETNLSRSLELLAEYGFVALGLDERGDKQISALPAFPRTVLVMGAEGDGLRRLVAEHCAHLVHLPTNKDMPSLNVSNAAAVALYALHAAKKG